MIDNNILFYDYNNKYLFNVVTQNQTEFISQGRTTLFVYNSIIAILLAGILYLFIIINKRLSTIIESKIDEIKAQEEILINQSKMAALGQMIDVIAHQWKQPLSIIMGAAQTQEIKAEYDSITKDDVKYFSNTVIDAVMHMSNTLDEFRGFFRENKSIINVNLYDTIKKTLELIATDIRRSNLKIDIVGDKLLEINIIPNEFKHIILNLVSNSRDAFEERKIPKDERLITFEFKDEEKFVNIFVYDNAGGIPEYILPKLFDANITTKAQANGTGIGLYISRLIIEKIGGHIVGSNKNDGAFFQISIPKFLD